MKITLIVVAAVVAMWLAFMFLGKIFYWIGLAALCLIVYFVINSCLGLTSKRRRIYPS